MGFLSMLETLLSIKETRRLVRKHLRAQQAWATKDAEDATAMRRGDAQAGLQTEAIFEKVELCGTGGC